MAEGERQPDREVVSVYQEHTALAASSLSVVVPSSSLLQHLPARHQAEQDPDPSTAPSQDQSPINCSLLQAQLSSSADSTPHLSVSTPNSVSNPESGPSGLYLFHTDSAPSSPISSYSPAAEPTSASQDPTTTTTTAYLHFSLFPSHHTFINNNTKNHNQKFCMALVKPGLDTNQEWHSVKLWNKNHMVRIRKRSRRYG